VAFESLKISSELSPAQKLLPPGQGLLTVTTGGDYSKKIAKLFPDSLIKNWSSEVARRCQQDWVIVGCPSDVGGGISRGAAQGPLGIRAELYSGKAASYAQHDIGDIPCIPQLLHDSMYSSDQLDRCHQSLWNKKRVGQASVSPLNVLADLQEQLFKDGKQVFVLGGDHSISYGPLEALHRAKLTPELGVLHLDAHTDLMEERFGIEHCFSTWAAHAVKKCVASNWFQLGVRTSRKTKKDWEKQYGLQQYWAEEVKKKTAKHWADIVAEQWLKTGVQRFYVSLDIDVLDPKQAPSTGTPEKGGLSLSFVKTLLLELTARFPLVGADLVEVAPHLGSKADQKKTLNSAVECLKVLLP